MVDIWFISDPHFGHANIIKYCNRPFANTQEMDAVMIERWNSVVKPQDHIYCGGDFTMNQLDLHRVAPQLYGHKRLILGNHDNSAPMRDYCKYFEKILMWRLFKPIIFTHVPIHRDNFGKAQVNVHGHIHEKPSPAGPYINMCVEVRNYTPVHLDMLLAEAKSYL